MKASGPDSKDLLKSVNSGDEQAQGSRGPRGLNLVVQGKPVRYHGAGDVRSLLEERGENPLYANVRINGDVLGRRDFENIPVKEGDTVDFLYYMGGG